MTKKELFIATLCVMAGFLMAPTTEIEKEVIKEVKVMEYSETCEAIQTENRILKKKNGIQKQVMSLSDEIIVLGGQGMGYCAATIGAIVEYDFDRVDYLTEKTELLTPQVLEAGDKKYELLEQLKNIK